MAIRQILDWLESELKVSEIQLSRACEKHTRDDLNKDSDWRYLCGKRDAIKELLEKTRFALDINS
jgi:hypothetical protein